MYETIIPTVQMIAVPILMKMILSSPSLNPNSKIGMSMIGTLKLSPLYAKYIVAADISNTIINRCSHDFAASIIVRLRIITSETEIFSRNQLSKFSAFELLISISASRFFFLSL